MTVAANKVHMELWLAALESGEYEQGKGALCKDGKYCCLGVACDVFRKHSSIGGKWERSLAPGQVSLAFIPIGGAPSNSELPDVVQKWLGMETHNPVLEYIGEDEDGDEVILTCIDANDTEDWDFNRIAKALREMYINPPAYKNESIPE